MENQTKETKNKVKEMSTLIKESFGVTLAEASKLLQLNINNGNK